MHFLGFNVMPRRVPDLTFLFIFCLGHNSSLLLNQLSNNKMISHQKVGIKIKFWNNGLLESRFFIRNYYYITNYHRNLITNPSVYEPLLNALFFSPHPILEVTGVFHFIPLLDVFLLQRIIICYYKIIITFSFCIFIILIFVIRLLNVTGFYYRSPRYSRIQIISFMK